MDISKYKQLQSSHWRLSTFNFILVFMKLCYFLFGLFTFPIINVFWQGKQLQKYCKFSLTCITPTYQMQHSGRITEPQSTMFQSDRSQVPVYSLFLCLNHPSKPQGAFFLSSAAHLAAMVDPKVFFPLARIRLG